MNGSIEMNRYMSRKALASELGTTWERVDMAIRAQGLQPCICGSLCYDLNQAREAVRQMEAHDAVAQRDATLAATALRERGGNEALVRWAEDIIGPLVRTAKRW